MLLSAYSWSPHFFKDLQSELKWKNRNAAIPRGNAVSNKQLQTTKFNQQIHFSATSKQHIQRRQAEFNSLAVELVITTNDFASEDGDLRRRRITEWVIERNGESVVPEPEFRHREPFARDAFTTGGHCWRDSGDRCCRGVEVENFNQMSEWRWRERSGIWRRENTEVVEWR